MQPTTPVFEARIEIGRTSHTGHIYITPVPTEYGPAFEWTFYEGYTFDWVDDEGVGHEGRAFQDEALFKARRLPDFASCVEDMNACATMGDPVEESEGQ